MAKPRIGGSVHEQVREDPLRITWKMAMGENHVAWEKAWNRVGKKIWALVQKEVREPIRAQIERIWEVRR